MATTIGSLDLNAFSDLYSDSTQYFWFEGNTSATYGAGAHVTLVPDTSFISNPTGQNILMNTDGFSIRNGLLPMMTLDNDSLDFNVVNTTAGTYVTTATFTATGAQIGQSGSTHLELNTGGLSILNGALPMMTLDNDSLDFNVVNTTAGTYTTTATFGSTGATIGQTNGAHIQISSSGLDVNTDSSTNIASFGINGARIGQSSGAHSVIDANGQKFYASDGSTLLANIGYGEGVAQTGTAIAPYYTFGVRRTTTTEYSSSSTYSVGNMCVHNEKVYVCINNITTPESWTSSHWRYYIGNYSYAEGSETIASGTHSHAEGERTIASGMDSHAEGYYTIASVAGSHAEGRGTTASGLYSHAEGGLTTARATYSHAEGSETIASEVGSHAEGHNTIAKGMHSHTQNLFTVATENSQTVIGKYNSATRSGSGTTADPYTYSDAGDYAFIIGNGTGDATAERSNALTVDWGGNVNTAGSFYGTTPWGLYSAGVSTMKSVTTQSYYWVTNFTGYVASARTNSSDVFDKVNAGLRVKRDGLYLTSLYAHFHGTAGDSVMGRIMRLIGGSTSDIGTTGLTAYVRMYSTWGDIFIEQMMPCDANDTICPQVGRYAGSGNMRFSNLQMNATYIGPKDSLVEL